MKIASLILIALLVSQTIARADEPAPIAKAPANGADMNFDLFGDKPKLTTAEEQAKSRHEADIARKTFLRRRLLTAHQAVGFVTLGVLALTLVLGTLDYVDKFGGGSYTNDFSLAHAISAGATTTSFAATGILALVAPNPYPKPIRFDAALMHKVFMALATACFAAEVILGPIGASRAGHLDEKTFALAHLVIGYGSFAFMGAGTLTFVFK